MPHGNHPEITPALLLRAYATGIFPMAESDGDSQLFWVDPEHRGIIPLDGFHVPRRLARTVRSRDFRVGIDTAFPEVVNACAGREQTWINDEIRALYDALFRIGHAHSVEIWEDGALSGGLYGVSLGAAFFGESMFSHRRDASKLALVALVARLRHGGFQLLDTQFVTDHLASLGAIEIPRRAYRTRLAKAILRPADFLALPIETPRQALLQLSTQMS